MSLPTDSSAARAVRTSAAHGPAFRSVGSLLAVFGCVLFTAVGLAATGGYYVGLDDRAARQTQAAAESIQRQYQLAQEDVRAGRYELARQRLEYVLGVDANYPGAAETFSQVQQASSLTPTSAPPTATVQAGSRSAGELLAQAQTRQSQGDWDGLIDALTELRSLDPTYEAVRVDGLFFLGFRNRGMARINGDQLEEGLFDLERAEAFGPLDSEAEALRIWAELYQTANSFWNINWERSAYYFSELYRAAPYFKDTYLKYFEATRNYAELLFAAGDYCGAEVQYANALQVQADVDLRARRDMAQAFCLTTPTPDPLAVPSPDPFATPDPNATPSPEGEATPEPTATVGP